MVDLIGQSLGRYHILERLGEGGMATVYRAYDTRLETDVAVKVIRTDVLPQNTIERALKRFELEAKALARLTHPNIVKVTDYGEYEGKPYLVMPYLPGGTLKQMLVKPVPWQDAAHLLTPVARALAYAHRQGMIHRDVKPSNILITEDGEPMLTDFGIAKIIDEESTLDLTGTSAAVGTPEYMAPEQVIAKTVDQRADIYALGVVLYEMITGRRPFQADTPMAVLFKHASEPLPNPRLFVPNLPGNVEKILIKALAKKPEDRYQDMAEFVSAMANGMEKQSISAFRNRKIKKDRTQAPAEHLTAPFDTQATIDQDAGFDQVTVTEIKKLIPRWGSVKWIALGCAIGWSIGMTIMTIISVKNFALNSAIVRYTIIGTISGFAIALVLRKEKLVPKWKNVFLITSGWAISWAIGMGTLDQVNTLLGPTISGAIGGLAIALILLRKKLFSEKQNLLIILGWVISALISRFSYAAIFSIIFDLMQNLINVDIRTLAIVSSISGILGGAIGGSIGGAIMVWCLRRGKE